MKTTRPLNTLTLFLLSLGLCGAACSRSPAPREEAPVAPPSDARVSTLERKVKEQSAELEQLRSLLAAERAKQAETEAALEAEKKKPAPLISAAPGGVTIATNNPLGQILQAVGSAMTNPAAMNAMRDNFGTWGRMRGHLYDDLLQGLSLSESQRQQFERLIRQRRNAQMGARWIGEEESKRQIAEAEDGLRKLLGSRYDELAKYDGQLPARMFTESFKTFLDGRQLSIDPARKRQMIEALAGLPGMSAGDQQGFSLQSTDGKRPDIGALVDRQLDQTAESYDRIVAAAKPILSADENKALTDYLDQRMQAREMGAQITRSIVPAILGTNGVPSLPGATGSVSVQTIIVDGDASP